MAFAGASGWGCGAPLEPTGWPAPCAWHAAGPPALAAGAVAAVTMGLGRTWVCPSTVPRGLSVAAAVPATMAVAAATNAAALAARLGDALAARAAWPAGGEGTAHELPAHQVVAYLLAAASWAALCHATRRTPPPDAPQSGAAVLLVRVWASAAAVLGSCAAAAAAGALRSGVCTGRWQCRVDLWVEVVPGVPAAAAALLLSLSPGVWPGRGGGGESELEEPLLGEDKDDGIDDDDYDDDDDDGVEGEGEGEGQGGTEGGDSSKGQSKGKGKGKGGDDDKKEEEDFDAHQMSIMRLILKATRRDQLMSGTDLSRLVTFNAPNKGLMALSCVTMLFAICCQLSLPLIATEVINAIIIKPNPSAVRRYLPPMFAMSVVTGAFVGVQNVVTSYANNRMVKLMQRTLFSKMLRQDMEFFDQRSSGELMSRLSADTATVGSVINASIVSMMQGIFTIFVVLVMEFTCSWQLTLAVFSLLAGFWAVCWAFGRLQELLSRKTMDDTSEMNHSALESIGLIKTVRAYHAEDWAIKEYFRLVDRRLVLQDKTARAQGTNIFLSYTFIMYMYTSALALGDAFIKRGYITQKELVAFTLYLGWGIGAVSSMTNAYGTIMNAAGAATSIFKLMDTEPTGPESTREWAHEREEESTTPPAEGGAPARDANLGAVVVAGEARPPARLEFKGVYFAYPSVPRKRVLKGLDLTVEAGTKVALVGASGCGKSSCINLMLRYYDPRKGAVELDGKDLRSIPLSELRQELAVVLQETPVFSMTVRDNICYPDLDASDAQVEEAARAAQAHQFITELESGYGTLVGDKGVKLSGGQKQRLALARALVRKPRLLLLDEATSALDAVTEHELQKVLNGLSVSSVVVAHRLSTVKNSKNIAVIKGGVVAELGAHSELVKTGGHYAKLVAKQREDATADD